MGEAKHVIDTVIFIVHSLVSSSIRKNTSPCRQFRIPSGRVYSAIAIYEPGLPKCVTCEWLYLRLQVNSMTEVLVSE